MRNRLTLLVLALAVLVTVVILMTREDGVPAPDSENRSPVIYTTFYPTTYFAETIAMGKVEVVNACPDDEDAIFWMPDRKTLEAYQKADLIIINGAGFEKWVSRASLPQERLVDSAKALPEPLIRYEKATTHSHGPAGAHAHTGIDGHTWVDPVTALIQSEIIYAAMLTAFPEHRDSFWRGFTKLKEELEALHREFKAISDASSRPPLLASHPAYNYIARRYDWHIQNLDLGPESLLSEAQIDDIASTLQTFPAKVLIWESEPSEDVRQQVAAALGLKSVVFSPCELLSARELADGLNYATVMKTNCNVMRSVLERVER